MEDERKGRERGACFLRNKRGVGEKEGLALITIWVQNASVDIP